MRLKIKIMFHVIGGYWFERFQDVEKGTTFAAATFEEINRLMKQDGAYDLVNEHTIRFFPRSRIEKVEVEEVTDE